MPDPENAEHVGMLVGFTVPELLLITATLAWQSLGEPGEDSSGKPVIEPLGLAGREMNSILEQLPEGWDTPDEEGFVSEELHYVFFTMDEGVPMTRWLRMILQTIYDVEPDEGELNADQQRPAI